MALLPSNRPLSVSSNKEFIAFVVILGKIDNSYFDVCIGTLEERGEFVSYGLLRFWRNKKSVNKVSESHSSNINIADLNMVVNSNQQNFGDNFGGDTGHSVDFGQENSAGSTSAYTGPTTPLG